MKTFSLLSLVTVLALFAWWFTQMSATRTTADPEQPGSYRQAIDSAEEAADILSR